MSRNEGEKEEELLVRTVFLHWKELYLSRVTVVREGMSVCEHRVIGSTLKSDRTRIVECVTVFSFSSEFSEFGQVYSSARSIITTSHYQLTRFIFKLESKSTISKSNGSQFRQVYILIPL